MTTTHLSLILGGARSGKTKLAEKRARDSGLKLVYVATATAGDDEMHQRIQQHQKDRHSGTQCWLTVEQPLRLGEAIAEYAKPGYCLVVDCLTLWLSNCLHENCWELQREKLFEALTIQGATISSVQPKPDAKIILVSNETGLGIVPMGQLSRQFVDESGFLHQRLADLASQVTLVVAGLPTELKNV